MRQGKDGVDPPRIVTAAAPTRGSAPADKAVGHERRFLFESGSGIELDYPARLVWPSPWIGHIPFALWLVEVLRPRVVVELGVHSGNSYCAFLQAVQSLSLAARCYGIDHWRGDEHSDHYPDDVYAELCSYHDPLYGTFSTLIRATFEEALPYFSDRSVDLLHIDGFHTYDAVAKDFSDWLPKMSPRGVVLFHDINVREREFGVWRFWEEMEARYQTFSFVHSHGLGLASVGTEPPPVQLQTLLALSDPDSISGIRAYFARLGMSLVDRFALRQAESIARRVRAGDADLEAARAEIGRHVETVDAFRMEVGKATAQVAVLQDELTATRAEVVRQIEAAARLQQELVASRAETARQTTVVGALQQEGSDARSEIARLTDATSLGQTEVRRATDRVALLEGELEAARAAIARQLEAVGASRPTTADVTAQVAALGEETLRARGQMSEAIAQRERATQLLRRQITATAGLQRELAAARSELALRADAASLGQTEAQRAADRLALLEDELQSARAEIARQLEAAGASRPATADVTEQVAALGNELVRARGQMSEAIAERDKAIGGLQQEITATAGVRRELAALRQNEAVIALVKRLASVKHMIPGPLRRYMKNRLLGVRP
jgi:chromosome segregation ATPase